MVRKQYGRFAGQTRTKGVAPGAGVESVERVLLSPRRCSIRCPRHFSVLATGCSCGQVVSNVRHRYQLLT